MRVLGLIWRTIAQLDVIMKIPVTGRDQPGKKRLHILEEARFMLIDRDCGRGMLRGDGDEAIPDAGPGNGFPDICHQVMQGNTPPGVQLDA
jgi:hypothetical protein